MCAPMSRPLKHRRQRLPCKPRLCPRCCRPRLPLLAPAQHRVAECSDTGTMPRCCEHADAGQGRRRGSEPGSSLAMPPRLPPGCAAVHARPWREHNRVEADARHVETCCCAQANDTIVRVIFLYLHHPKAGSAVRKCRAMFQPTSQHRTSSWKHVLTVCLTLVGYGSKP